MLTGEQLSSFDRNGFVVIEGVLGDEDLQPLEREYDELLESVAAKLFSRGGIPSAFGGLPFGERFARVLAHCPDGFDYFNISLPLINGKVEADKYHAHTGPAVFGLLRNDKLLDVVESIVGPEVSSSPVQQMRLKPPRASLGPASVDHSGVGMTTWHQDIVAILPEADDTEQLTAWVAVTDANEQNGCLVSIPGSHRQGPQVHCPGDLLAREPNIPRPLVDEHRAVPLPVKRGGVILFHKQNIHRALPNRSKGLRWSLDLRYHPVGQPSGRPAFPGFVARSRTHPETELRDPHKWQQLWDEARIRIVNGQHQGPIFAEDRWSNPTVC